MDYEKKYNEALERARALWREAIEKDYVEDYVKDYETIFPELRESEDEKIRRTLVEYFGPEAQLDFIRGVKIQKIRDWLEKQKEPTKEELYAEAGTTENEYIANTMKMVRAMREKQKEQKPAEWSEEDENIRKLLIGQVHRNIEDETNDLAQSVYDGIKGHDPDIEESIEDWKKCLAWLKSLRPDIYKNCNNRRKPGED